MAKSMKRPFIFTNMAMSIDGKIATHERGDIALGSTYDRQLMDELRARSDVVLVGSATLRASPRPMKILSAALIEKRLQKGLSPQPVSAVMSASLNLPMNSPLCSSSSEAAGRVEKRFSTPLRCARTKAGGLARTEIIEPRTRTIAARTRAIEHWIFTSKSADPEKIKYWEKRGKLFISKKPTVQPSDVVKICQEKNIKNLLIEGGGELTFSFLKEGLIDELYVTLTPKLIGGREAPTSCDGKGFCFEDIVNAELVDFHRVEDELYLHYRIKYSKAKKRQ